MLPVTAGSRATRQQIFAYSLVMAACAVAPWPLGEAGAIYGIAAAALSALFVLLAWPVLRNRSEDPAAMQPERRLFKFSILYLFGLFACLIADRWLAA
jgi:protoheme IX farnesyltransferase